MIFQKITTLVVLAALCLNFKAVAQINITLSGSVTDQQAKPISGINIKIGSQMMGSTNAQGAFSIRTTLSKGTLFFSGLGYQSKAIAFEGTTQNMIVVLLEEAAQLMEVEINAGYYTVKEKLRTGGISTVSAKDIEHQPVSNPLAALQGRVPGLIITQTSGVAGAQFKVQLRGQSALDLSLSQNDPLFVIDGVPFETGLLATNQLTTAANNPTSIGTGGLSALNTVNPADIEQVTVLKDADATAIYGSRGANGVILISTKKGREGKLSINFNATAGISKVGRTMPMLNTQQYVAMRKEAFANDQVRITNTNAPDIMLWDTTRYTDFKDLLIGRTAQDYRAQLSLSGGNAQSRFLLSTNYQRANSVYSSDLANEITGFRLSIGHDTKDKKIQIQALIGFGQDHNELPRVDLTRYINTIPNLNLYTNEGKLRWEDKGVVYNTISDLTNPLSLLNESYRSLNSNLNASMNVSYVLAKSLKLSANVGFNQFSTAETYQKPNSSIDSFLATLPSASLANARNTSWIIEPQLSYQKSVSQHQFSVLLGSTLQHRQRNNNRVMGTNYASDLLLGSMAAAGTTTSANDEVQYRYGAVFGRVNYSYQQRYVLNLSGRRDGSSRFGPDRRWANFGAIGLAWLFSDWTWLKNHLPQLSFGKLRASYGTTGNDQIGDYMYLNLWNNGGIYDGAATLFPNSLYNPAYSWEINKKTEVGLDLSFWKDRLQFSMSYYNNRSNNQLINYTMASQAGFFQVIKNFPGKVENKGLEMSLSADVLRSEFKWSGSLNVSFSRNKLLAFPGIENSSYRSTYVIGEPLSLFRGLIYQGVNSQNGLYSFWDANNDGALSTADYQLLGSVQPKYFGGLQQEWSYKGLSLNVFFHFVKQRGLNYFNDLASKAPGQAYNQPTLVLNRWRKPGDQADVQRFTAITGAASGSVGRINLSSAKYTDASFIRLKNISLGYQLPQSLLAKLKLKSLRIYTEGQNLLTFTSYKGADPETQRFYVLPPLRTWVWGTQLNF